MKQTKTMTTFVEYSPLPRPEDLVGAFIHDANLDCDIQIENPVNTEDGCWEFDLRCPANGSLVRVSSYSHNDADARKFLATLITRVSDFDTGEDPQDGLDHPNTPECKQAVLDHLRSTKYIVQTTPLLLGEDNNAWDIESGIHISLGRLSTENSTGVISFYRDDDKLSFSDEVSNYLEFRD